MSVGEREYNEELYGNQGRGTVNSRQIGSAFYYQGRVAAEAHSPHDLL